jgi:LysM repeat protein
VTQKRLLPLGLLFAISPFIVQASTFGAITGTFFGFLSGGREAFSGQPIATAYNSQTVPLLYAAAHVDPNPAKGGGDIVIDNSALVPESGPTGTIADVETPRAGQISLYIVRSGDSLGGIAKMFGVSVNTIVWANNLKKGAPIKEGQQLVVLPVTGVRYTVAKGDTIQSIAKKYNGDVAEILQYNDLSSASAISVGDTLLIPGGEMSAPVVYTPAQTKAKVIGGGGPNYDSYFIDPLPGAIKTQGLHGYNAVDLAMPKGTPILAAATGMVIISREGGWNGGYGNYVVLSHDNGTQTLYAHMTRTIVSMGQNVVQGQVIGYVGETGLATGPHLHFEVRGAKNPMGP